ncbi:MAG: hypothetical protein AB7O56_01085 [Bauldia sp.]
MSILRFVGSILFILGIALVFVGLRDSGDDGGTTGYLIGAAVLVLLGVVLFIRGRPRAV